MSFSTSGSRVLPDAELLEQSFPPQLGLPVTPTSLSTSSFNQAIRDFQIVKTRFGWQSSTIAIPRTARSWTFFGAQWTTEPGRAAEGMLTQPTAVSGPRARPKVVRAPIPVPAEHVARTMSSTSCTPCLSLPAEPCSRRGARRQSVQDLTRLRERWQLAMRFDWGLTDL